MPKKLLLGADFLGGGVWAVWHEKRQQSTTTERQIAKDI